MNNPSLIIKYVAAALIVIVLGGLLGWYVVLQRQITSTESGDAARGTGAAPSFGSSAGSTFQNASGSILAGEAPTEAGEQRAAPRLWRVTRNPVAGFGFASTTPRLFFAETSTGNILQADPLTSEIARLSNTLLPKPFDAQFSSEGLVVMRFFEGETIRTYAARMAIATSSTDTASSSAKLVGAYLTANILDVAIAPKETLVYVVQDSGGGASIVQSDWKGGSQKKLFTVPLSGWHVHVAEDGSIVLAQRASDSIPGYAFVLGTSGSLTPLLDGEGLTILPKNVGTALYGTGSGSLTLAVRTSNGTSMTLPLATTAEKCVWSRGANLVAYCAVPRVSLGKTALLERYQGVRHTSDTWYRIDVQAGTAEEIFAPDSSAEFDVEKPVIDAGNRYLAFTNAADKSLWLLRITP